MEWPLHYLYARGRNPLYYLFLAADCRSLDCRAVMISPLARSPLLSHAEVPRTLIALTANPAHSEIRHDAAACAHALRPLLRTYVTEGPFHI